VSKKKVSKEVSEYMADIGSRASRKDRVKAAKKRAKSLTPEERSAIAKKAAAARWGKKVKGDGNEN
jgi:hypothetical protein